MWFKNFRKKYNESRDKLFLARLVRVLNKYVLSANIYFDGKIGGRWDYLKNDSRDQLLKN